MDIRSSLKRKSFFTLAIYLCFLITTIGTVSYLVVEPPVRSKLQDNLDIRTELLSTQIQAPINRALGVLQTLVSIAGTETSQDEQNVLLFALFEDIDGVAVSGGLWPEPYSIDPDIPYMSMFYNRASDGQVDRIYSWNNEELGGYNEQDWYSSAANQPKGTVTWSEVYIDAYTHVQMITASSPYYINNQFSGVATVDIALSDLIDFVAVQAEQYDLGVLLKDGYGKLISEHNFNIVENIYISTHRFGEFDWSVDVVNSKRLVNEEVYDLVTSVELGIIPIMLTCILIGYYLINQYLIKPVVIIAKKLNNSKHGGIIDMTYHSNDEIRQLIDSFNQKTVYLEEEKIKAQASTKAKSAFLATLSHEIRTPMNGVLGSAQILLKSDLTAEQRKHLKSLYDSGDHMMALLNEILDFSKIEQGHLELDNSPFPIDSIIGSVNSVYHTLCAEKGLEFKVYSEVPNDRWYNTDKARVRQILFNLLNNAVKFTSRGFVEVYLQELVEDEQTYLQIRVRDSGIGIAKEAQDKIFRPFEQAESSTTRRFGGTGLGLAIVKQITELMGGSISVTSELGIGTNFHVKVATEICSSGHVEIPVARKLSYDGLRVLIVEDNRTNTLIIDTFMKGKGFDCTCVENGEQAVLKVAEEQFDLILMDNHMPVMDGVEAITAIRALSSDSANVLIFGCTADVFRETRERMLASGADYIIAKPIDENELDDALYRYSDKLFQYRKNQGQVSAPFNVEEALISLCIAVENRDYPNAQQLVVRMLSLGVVAQSDELKTLLDGMNESLINGIQPSGETMDLLTVLLAEKTVI